jgi:hypothetical protein
MTDQGFYVVYLSIAALLIFLGMVADYRAMRGDKQ